jgi:hypothetical protein
MCIRELEETVFMQGERPATTGGFGARHVFGVSGPGFQGFWGWKVAAGHAKPLRAATYWAGGNG